jgi:hypothetical protein
MLSKTEKENNCDRRQKESHIFCFLPISKLFTVTFFFQMTVRTASCDHGTLPISEHAVS